jgi:hypothetical protein
MLKSGTRTCEAIFPRTDLAVKSDGSKPTNVCIGAYAVVLHVGLHGIVGFRLFSVLRMVGGMKAIA